MAPRQHVDALGYALLVISYFHIFVVSALCCLLRTVQYSTYSTVQYIQYIQYIQYSTVQYSTVQYSTVQYSTVQYSTVQYSTYITVHTLQYIQ